MVLLMTFVYLLEKRMFLSEGLILFTLRAVAHTTRISVNQVLVAHTIDPSYLGY
jgi:hypothetical protein